VTGKAYGSETGGGCVQGSTRGLETMTQQLGTERGEAGAPMVCQWSANGLKMVRVSSSLWAAAAVHSPQNVADTLSHH
jgi:hypothetical protein